jgi:hypothetical protein
VSARVKRIHPSSMPTHDVLTGHRAGPRGFWRGPDINVAGFQQVNPHVSRDIARQWLLDESDGDVVDKAEHERALDLIETLGAALAKEKAERKQLESRLLRIYPGGRRKKVTA